MRNIGKKRTIVITFAIVLAIGAIAPLAAWSAGGGIVDPATIELHLSGCATDDGDPTTGCHVYALRDETGNRSGSIAKFREPIEDADGNTVGKQFAECVSSKGAGEVCTLIEVLHDGPYTDPGTIVLTGLSNGTLAVTGGSGAYANVRGDATLEGGFVLTLELQP